MTTPTSMTFTAAEIADLLSAIEEAQNELCVDPRLKESCAYVERLRALSCRLTKEGREVAAPIEVYTRVE